MSPRRAAAAALAAALGLAGPVARACGHCVEDKMAAVYDHAVVSRALARGQRVAFFALEGPLPAGDTVKRAIETLADAAPGVARGSARASSEAATLAVAYDPRRVTTAELERALSRRLAPRGLSLALLRVIDAPGAGTG